MFLLVERHWSEVATANKETSTTGPGYNDNVLYEYDTPYIASSVLRYQLIPRCEP
jgi:hypothetical protein